ncbi:hypothetical protein HPP92_020637 [Vanilla planifolia]|uniref:Uncharacterized protein n=1 Tax=Vanilla planifolia TaxID=51239 RepID=A0A835UJZ0_VANPL|nr:hypothetical protein HPP92_020637 [Vanilla planifolia]
MDAITNSKVYKSLQSYWRRRSYQRLEDVSTTKKAAVRLGGGRKVWKAVVVRSVKLRLKKPRFRTPGKILSRLRNAYVDAMLLLAGEAEAS